MISLFAVWIARRPASSSLTWGYHRYEVVGAIASVSLVWMLTGILVVEAIGRLMNPSPVDGFIMFIVATLGLLVNLAMMKILHQDVGGGGSLHGHSHAGGGGHSHGGGSGSASASDSENLNVRAAYIHVLGDLIQSVGVMIASIIIWFIPTAHMADPLCTLLFAILVLFTTYGVMQTAVLSILNAAPESIDIPSLLAALSSIEGVSNVHDVHVWSYASAGDPKAIALSVHLAADEPKSVLRAARAIATAHGISHATIQVELCGSEDIADCMTALVGSGCDLDLYALGAAPKSSVFTDICSAIAGRSPNVYMPPGAAQPVLRVRGPNVHATHMGSDGTGHLIVTPKQYEAPAFGSGHSHSANDHGHSHACSTKATTAVDHGHSHGSADSHGHSHGVSAASAASSGHGHSEGGHSHESASLTPSSSTSKVSISPRTPKAANAPSRTPKAANAPSPRETPF